VDAVADAQETLLRLEVDVGGSALYRVGQQGRNEAHDRLRVRVAGRLEALIIDLPGLDFVQDSVDREVVSVVLVDRPADLALAGEARFQRELAAQLCSQDRKST